ncbi:hypothetical protein SAMN04488241_101364 [Sphingomonas rubra]|uniref:SH3 domain-containing protein n=2 Tax=Sphingomonas rubra TaxID=634430 RepID=A0A1I5Q067_9SPHN|nr:hypothetical protein SAMN04488241_101364 [Sphingomonas rubra]
MRLADRVFAPHYAQAVSRRLREPTTLREARDPASPALVTLDAGASFELLDLIGDDAWGVAPTAGLVGYLPAATLAPLPAAAGS